MDSPGSGGKLVQNLTACTMQRQAKRLRAETEATDYSTIAPGFGKIPDIRGSGERRRCLWQMKAASPLRSRAFRGPSRSRTAKGICGKAEEPFLFSGKYRKEKWVLIYAG